jgi:hypothetical protein
MLEEGSVFNQIRYSPAGGPWNPQSTPDNKELAQRHQTGNLRVKYITRKAREIIRFYNFIYQRLIRLLSSPIVQELSKREMYKNFDFKGRLFNWLRNCKVLQIVWDRSCSFCSFKKCGVYLITHVCEFDLYKTCLRARHVSKG